MKQQAGRIFLLAISILLSGCWPSGESPDPPPRYAYGELVEFGVTIAPESASYPIEVSDVISANNYDYIKMNILDVYFTPIEPYEGQENSPGELFDTSQLRFSIQNVDGSYTVIEPAVSEGAEPSIPYDASLIYSRAGHFNMYYQPDSRPWETLLSGPLSYMPSAATHIELWYREDTEATFQMVRRVALENLFVYKTYVIPKI